MRRKIHLSVGVHHPTEETWNNQWDSYIRGAKNICGGNTVGYAYGMLLTTRLDQVTCWSCFRNKKFQEILAEQPIKFDIPRAGQISMFELETPFSREYSLWLHDEWLKRCRKAYQKQHGWIHNDELWEKVKAETA